MRTLLRIAAALERIASALETRNTILWQRPQQVPPQQPLFPQPLPPQNPYTCQAGAITPAAVTGELQIGDERIKFGVRT